MRIKFWGVRGSIPTPLTTEQLNEKLFQAVSSAQGVNLADPAEVQAFIASLPAAVRGVVGGNTTCVEVDTGTETIIIDGGSGMRPLGYSLMAREFGRGQGVAHIFLTHAHWDHLQGYPFFLPAYVPGNKLIFYAVNYNPQMYLEHQQVAPMYFPIPPNAMPADKEFVQLREGETVHIGRTTVSSLSLYHPGTAYAYRFDDGESVFVFASDGEYKSLTESSLRRYVDFYANADALVFDAQFSLRDVFLSRADWGHSSAIIGVDIAERARVKKLITFHHDPTHSDEQIQAIAAAAREYAAVNQLEFETDVVVGSEGLELFLGEPMGLETVEGRDDTVWTLALAGHLNRTSADEARTALLRMLNEAPGGRVLLDLTLLATADALGVKGLLDAARAVPSARVAALAPATHIRRALELVNATETLKLFHSRQQALTTLAGPAHLRLAASTIGGQYQLDQLDFVDETGVVYRGADRSRGAPVAARVVAGQAQEEARLEFTRQVEQWRAVADKALWPVLDFIDEPGWAAMICPLPEGQSLREWHAAQSNRTIRWKAATSLCQALAALHGHGQIHGRLRPESVIVNRDGVARIACDSLFAYPSEFGPAAYRAPEQLRHHLTDMRSDVYVLGMMLYELMLDEYPFAGETQELRFTLQLYSQPQSPRSHWPEIPDELEQLLMRMLAPSSEERFATGADVLAAAQAIHV